MATIENKAFEAYQEDRAKAPKYQTPDSCWMDWYKKGYRKADQEMKEKVIKIFNELIVELEENPDMTIDEAMTVFQERINQQ